MACVPERASTNRGASLETLTHRGLIVLALLVVLPGRAFAQADPAGAPVQPSVAPAAASPSSQASGNGSQPPPEGFFPEPALLTRAMDYVSRKIEKADEPKSGFYPEFSNMITGAGWVSVGPGYRQYLFDRQLLLDTSAAVSWHFYKMLQGRVELPELAEDRLTVGVQAMWQDNTQVNYFGIGPDAPDSARSQYRLQDIDYVAYSTWRLNDSLSINGIVGWLPDPKLMLPGGTFRGDSPATQLAFPDDPAVSLSRQPDFLHGTAAINSDTRDHKGHPTTGGKYGAAMTVYSDRTTGLFSFRQYEAEGLQLVPLLDRRWVFAFRGWVVFSDVDAGHEVPFYLLPTIGGSNTLRSFHSFQFHDLNSLVVNAESRWSIFTHVDAAVFIDAGNVAPSAGDLNLDQVSYGAGLRLHTSGTTIGRFDVANGRFGWMALFRTNDPLRLSRGKRRIAAVPFTP